MKIQSFISPQPYQKTEYVESLGKIIDRLKNRSIHTVLDLSNDDGEVIQAFFKRRSCQSYLRIIFDGNDVSPRFVPDHRNVTLIPYQDLDLQSLRYQAVLCLFRTHVMSGWREEMSKYFDHLDSAGEMIICDWSEDELSPEVKDMFVWKVMANVHGTEELNRLARTFEFLRHEDVRAYLQDYSHFSCTLFSRRETYELFDRLWDRLFYVHPFWKKGLDPRFAETIRRQLEALVSQRLKHSATLNGRKSFYVIQCFKD